MRNIGNCCRLSLRESERLNSIITDFLAYSRGKQYSLPKWICCRLLEDTLTLLEHRLAAQNAGIPSETQLRRARSMDLADGDKLKQVFWNFCENAVRAMRQWRHAHGFAGIKWRRLADQFRRHRSGHESATDRKNIRAIPVAI